MGSLFREFVIGADSFGQLSSGIPNRILSGLMYWLIVAIVIYFGEWIKNAIPINLMVFLLLSHVIYIYFHANIYYHISMKGESI